MPSSSRAGNARALALFLVTYLWSPSYTETGLSDASMYLLELALAASLLVPPAPEGALVCGCCWSTAGTGRPRRAARTASSTRRARRSRAPGTRSGAFEKDSDEIEHWSAAQKAAAARQGGLEP